MELWRAEIQERPAVMSWANMFRALALHIAFFLGFFIYSVVHGLFESKEQVIPIDLTVVVNENLDGKEDEPPPLAEPPKPPPPQPKPKPKPVVKKPDPPKALEQIVTNIVTKVDKKEEKKEPPKKPEPPKKTAKELREERIKAMRERATSTKKKPEIIVKNVPSGDGRTDKKTLSNAEIMKLLNQGYKPGKTTQLAQSELQLGVSLIRGALEDKWNQLNPSVGRSGVVFISVRLNSSGGLTNVQLARSCGDRISDDAALSVARRITYVQGLSQEFISQFRKETLTIQYEVKNR